MARVCIIGAGYVGIASGVGLAILGHSVGFLDTDESKIVNLSDGRSPIAEEGIEEALGSLSAPLRVKFSIKPDEVVPEADFVFLCVPTPQDNDGRADLQYVIAACESVGPLLKSESIVVMKSTVPVGTSNQLRLWLGRSDVNIASNPEFLRQGTALKDFLHPTRIVIGGADQDVLEKVAGLYEAVDAPVLMMSSESAETLKYAANSFLATKLTFINAIADICEVVGANVVDVVRGLSLDPRIGALFLQPGPGWGGSCFPKDTRALVRVAAERGYDFALLRGVIDTNDRHYGRIVEKIKIACGGTVDGRTVAAWGLTFKAHTDDLRDSPAVSILGRLLTEGGVVCAFDPRARNEQDFLPGIERMSHPVNACRGANALVVLTEWPMFSEIDPVSVGAVMKSRAVIDGRNILDRERWEAAGFNYCGVGR